MSLVEKEEEEERESTSKYYWKLNIQLGAEAGVGKCGQLLFILKFPFMI